MNAILLIMEIVQNVEKVLLLLMENALVVLVVVLYAQLALQHFMYVNNAKMDIILI